MAHASNRADEIFTAGPEVLTERAAVIVTGTVSAYSRQVLASSEPPGPNAIPLKWTVAARVENPIALKGSPTGPIGFDRQEQSALISDTVDVPQWEQDYGDLRPSGQVVLFLSSDPANLILAVVPSGDGELDLASLIRDIVAIQANPENSKLDAWLSYLHAAATDHGREAALRSLVQMNVDWERLRPSLTRLAGNSMAGENLSGFVFGILVFGLTNQKWAQNQVPVADFLFRQFEYGRSSKLTLQYVLSLKLLLRYTMEEAARRIREPLRARIVEGLKRNEAALSRMPQVAEQYRQMRAAYPGLL